MPAGRRSAAILGIASACSAAPIAAQVNASVDLGASVVRYDGFLSSGSGFLTPSVRFDSRSTTLAAQGTYVVFESGNSIFQATGGGAWLVPSGGWLRPELGGALGVSTYSEAPTAGHLRGRVRLHAMQPSHGAWIGGGLGRAYFGSDSHATDEIGAGAWLVRGDFGLSASVTRSHTVDTSYVDVNASVRWASRWVAIDLFGGARVWSRAGGEGSYGEVVARIPIGQRFAALLSGGRYPSDPTRGTLAARYASIGLRVTPLRSSPRPNRALADLLQREARVPEPAATRLVPRLSVTTATGPRRAIRVEAAGARMVELMGDFTDWQPVPLGQVSGSAFEIALPLPPGTYRLNVRVDGGPWMVPRGVRMERDDFGGEVGIVVVW